MKIVKQLALLLCVGGVFLTSGCRAFTSLFPMDNDPGAIQTTGWIAVPEDAYTVGGPGLAAAGGMVVGYPGGAPQPQPTGYPPQQGYPQPGAYPQTGGGGYAQPAPTGYGKGAVIVTFWLSLCRCGLH